MYFKCTSLTIKQFNLLGNSEVCANCTLDIISFQKLSNSEFADLYQITQIEVSKEIKHALNLLHMQNTSEYIKAQNIKKSCYKANSISLVHVNIRSLAKNFNKLEDLLHEMQV